jgi:hypothetical protein
MTNRPSSPNANAAFLVLGLAAGAAVTWMLTEMSKEKLPTGALGDLVPKDVLEKATKALREGKDRVIEAVDEASRKFIA